MFPKFQLFFDDADALGGSGGATQSDLDILNAPEPETETETPEEPEVVEPQQVTFDDLEDEEEKEPKAKTEEPKADDPEDAEIPAGQLRFKDVKSRYPNIFKEIPQLATAIRNDRAYSEIFTNPEDARDAAKVASYFNQLETNIMSGSAKELLNDIENANKDAFKRVAKDFLPTIREKSMELFAEVTLPVINDVLRSAIRDADGSENVNLRNAALHIAKYLYGKPEIPNLETQEKVNPEAEKVQKERQAFWQEKAQDFSNECFANGRDETLAEIAKGIDNDKSITPFLKNTLKDKIFKEVDELLGKDVRHLRQMNALWRRAESTGFPKESRRQIIDAYLRGAKVLIPAVRQKLRAEAGLQVPQGKTNGKQETTQKRTNIPQSSRQASGQAGKTPSARDVNWGKTSDLDFLNGKYTPKRRSQ